MAKDFLFGRREAGAGPRSGVPMLEMKDYRLIRTEGGLEVLVLVQDKERQYELLPDESQAVWKHSPDGFEWGYAGSGPAQLALAILLDFLPPSVDRLELAIAYHQAFKFRFVSEVPYEGGLIRGETIERWLANEE